MSQTRFPPGWDEERVRRVLAHYEQQSPEEAVAEDEASFTEQDDTVMKVPHDLVPAVRQLIAKHQESFGAPDLHGGLAQIAALRFG